LADLSRVNRHWAIDDAPSSSLPMWSDGVGEAVAPRAPPPLDACRVPSPTWTPPPLMPSPPFPSSLPIAGASLSSTS
jgi:hypothetical protein